MRYYYQMEREKITCHLYNGPLDRQSIKAFPDETIVLEQDGFLHQYVRKTGNLYQHERSTLTPRDRDPVDRDSGKDDAPDAPEATA